GRERNAITGFVSEGGRGRLWLIDRSWRPTAAELAKLGQPSFTGVVVYRLTCRNRISEPRYRWPAEALQVDPPRICFLGDCGGSARSDEVATASPEEACAALRGDRLNLLLIDSMPWTAPLAKVLAEATERGIATVYRARGGDLEPRFSDATDEASARVLHESNQVAARRRSAMVSCDLVLAADAPGAARARADYKPVIEAPVATPLAPLLAANYLELRRPRVSIVTILYNKARELPAVLESYARQSYLGEI